jgi:UDP-N-acetyl-D-mannosaminuronate dehydrogenase
MPLANEFSDTFSHMDTGTFDMIVDAGRKWSFSCLSLGLVSGHGISTDSYNLVHKSSAKICIPQ